MANNDYGHMGIEHGITGVQDRVHRSPPFSDTNSLYPSSAECISEVSSPRRSGCLTGEESNLSGLSAIPGRLLVHLLSRSEENRRLEADLKPEASEQVHQTQTFPYGIVGDGLEVPNQRCLGYFNRSSRCISAHTNTLRFPKVAPIPHSRAGICVPLPALWPVHSTTSFHSRGQGCGGVLETPRSHYNPILRRLVDNIPDARTESQTDSDGDRRCDTVGLHSEHEQVTLRANSNSNFSGGKSGLGQRSRNSHGREGRQHNSLCISTETDTVCTSTGVVEGSGSYGEPSGSGSLVSSQDETNPAPLPVPFQSGSSLTLQDSSNDRHCASRVRVVGITLQSDKGNDFSHATPSSGVDNGCIQDGMGRPSSGSSDQWILVSGGDSGPHKPTRTMGSVQFPHKFQRFSGTQKGPSTIRQFHSCVLHKQAGGDEVPHTVSAYTEDAYVVHRSSHSFDGSPHSRRVKLSGGQPVQGDTPESNRMVSLQTDCPDNLRENMVSINRPVCISSKPPAASVLLSQQGRESAGSRRSVDLVETNGSICISTHLDLAQGNREDREGRLSGDFDSTLLATPVLVSESGGTSGGSASAASDHSRPSPNARIESTVPQCGTAEVNCLDIIRQRFQAEGLSEATADLAARGRRPATLRIYSYRVRPYIKWCRERQVSPTRAPIAKVAEFLKSRFDMGMEASTVKGYKSAIQSIHIGCQDGSTVQDSRTLHFLLEGMNIERPRKRKVMPSWDLPTVLKFLNGSPFEPIQSASLRDLTIKTAFLVAMASGRRCSELHALATGQFIVFSNSGVFLHFRPGFLSKNERCDFVASPLFLPYLVPPSSPRKRRLGCPVRAIKWYLDRTQTVRGQIAQLFVTTCKPYRPAAKATIAGWLVEAISKAGAVRGETNPTAHSTRAISSSWAFSHGLSLKEIVNTVSWRTHSTFVSTYLRDLGPCSDQAHYAGTVLRAASHSH